MTRSKYTTRLTALVTATLGLVAAAPEAATAGSYQALSCDYAPVGGKDDAWESFNFGARRCPTGVDPAKGLRHSFTTSIGNGHKGGHRFKTPLGTTLSRFEGKISGWRKGDGNLGSGIFSPETSEVTRYGIDPGGNLYYKGYGVGPGGDRVEVALPAGSNSLVAAVSCGSSRSCISDPGSAEAHVNLYASEVTVEDPVMPVLALTGGTLSTSATQSGTADLTFDASDNVGINEARLLIDGVEKDRETFTCDFSAAIPCSNQTAKRLSFDSKTIPDGTHNARVEVLDAAGNAEGEDRTVAVRNSAAEDTGSSDSGSGSSTSSSSTETIDRRTLTETPAAIFGSPAAESIVTLKASKRSLKNGRSVAFSGAVLAGTSPFNDTIVALQARVGSRWVTFKNVRTNTAGTFGARYRFTRTFRTQTYTFRARVSKQRGFALDRNSRSLRVKVRR